MRGLNRLLAWEVIGVHLLTGLLFLAASGILLANTTLGVWWIAFLLGPLTFLLVLGWAYEAWIIVRAVAHLRRGSDQAESR